MNTVKETQLLMRMMVRGGACRGGAIMVIWAEEK